ncbi:hypothetical protein [uncultured Chryseobacterium sp.]|uniref:hypothetical protein n=1 Tax=uncultured Chryseobacterium sp. TaxID=259322 RepID=UPI0025E6EB0E|nr:hypothetical protein [uncultured Chryseobacterium sp.]
MKKNLSALLLILLFATGFSQDYKAGIAISACECFKKLKAENTDPEILETKLGFCIINAAEPYAKQLKKEYNLDILRDESSETGKLVATWILKECPDLFLEMVDHEEKNGAKVRSSEMSVSGTVSRIEKDEFIVFHIVASDGNLTKLYWITTIQSGLDLPKEYASLLQKKVTFRYYRNEIFDAVTNNYRNLNIISALKMD